MARLLQEKLNLDPHTLRWMADQHIKSAAGWDEVAQRIWLEMQPLFASDPKLKIEMLRLTMLRNQAYNERNQATRFRALATRIDNAHKQEWKP